jgi:hypothetical protein
MGMVAKDPTARMQEHVDVIRSRLRRVDAAREAAKASAEGDARVQALKSIEKETLRLYAAAEELHAAAKNLTRRAN